MGLLKKKSLFERKRSKATAGFMAFSCAALLWMSAPAYAQLGVDGVDPRITVQVTDTMFPETDSVLMMDDIKFDVYPDKSYAFEEHDAVKVLTKDGVEENASLIRVVDLSKSRIEVLQARTIKADGRVLKAGPPQLSTLAPNTDVYDSVKRFTLRFPDVEEGDVVEFHLRTVHKPKTGGHFWATTYVQNPMPIMDSTFTVTVPEDISFRWATPGHPESNPESSNVQRDGVSCRQLHWEVRREAAYEYQALAPKTITLLKRIEISSFKDWSDVAKFLKAEWDKEHLADEGLSLRVAGWLPATGDTMTRASALVKELNRKRKVASFLADEPGFHDPARVFEEDLVSPADVTLLTSVALSAAGIPNFPVASFGVTKESLEDELPNPEKVDKLILELPQRTGSSLWFDSESAGFILDVLPEKTSDKAAIAWDTRFAGGDYNLVNLELASAFQNREEVAVEGRLETNGKAELTLQFDRYGASALNSRQAARDISEGARDARDRALTAFFRNTARTYGPRARLLAQYFELDPDIEDPFTLSFTVAVPGFAQVQDQTMLVPLPRFLSSNLRAAARDRNRKTPLVFDQPYQQDIRIHLIFPEGSQVSTVPEVISKKTPEAEFVATGRAEGNQVWYVGRLTVLDPWVDEDAVQRNIETLAAALKSEDTILKVELAPGNRAAESDSEDDEDNDT